MPNSNPVIALMRGHAGFTARLRQYHPTDFALPAIVAHELFHGAYKGQRTGKNLHGLNPYSSKCSISIERMLVALANCMQSWEQQARRSALTMY